MAFATTTLSSAAAITDTSLVVASATSFSAGNRVIVDQEEMSVAQSYTSGTTIPVLRGQNGTVTAAHASAAAVAQGIGALDFPAAGAQSTVDPPRLKATVNSQELTATGATGSTATVVVTPPPAVLSVTGASGAGISLPKEAAIPGNYYILKNKMTGALNVYSSGATINGTTGTTAFAITATGNLGGVIFCSNAGAWTTVGIT